MSRLSVLVVAAVCVFGPVTVLSGDKPATKPPATKPTPPKRAPLPCQEQFDEFARKSRAMALESRVPFANPPEIHSGGGELKTTLTATYAHNRIGGDRVYLRSYNGFLVGPTLRVQPNDRLSIRLVNDLPDEPRPASEHNTNDPPHGANTTNLHTHGLHASPEDNGDNPLMAVPPNGRQEYSIRLGKSNSPALGVAEHPPGTHWYHPHKHGGAAIQLASGMAGALIVEGGLDKVGEIKSARERVIVFQQVPYSKDTPGTIEGEAGFTQARDWSRHLDRYTTINGLLKPIIELAPGEVERWRFIHAGLSARLNLQLRSVADEKKLLDLHEIAVDGIATGRLHSRPEIDLTAGGSSDVLVKAPDEPGEYLLIKLKDPNARLTDNPKIELTTPEDAVARVVVRGPKRAMSLPDPKALAGLAPYPPLEKVDVKRSVELGGRGGDYPRWTFDKKSFDPDRTDHDPTVGTTEEWTLTCTNQLHPFHIHVNAFQVVSHLDDKGKEKLSAEQLKAGVWRDTVLIDVKETIRLRMRFEDFPGKTVLHCHKMDHEDAGMMQIVRIRPAGNKAPPKANGDGEERADRPPPVAPAWKLPDANGEAHELKEFAGRRVVLVFFRGAGCLHCVEQLQALAKRRKDLEAAGITVVAISSDPIKLDKSPAREKSEWPFLIVADGAHEVFKQYVCYTRRPMHGVFAIDGRGRIRWQTVGETPFTDIDRIIEVGSRFNSD